MDAIALLLEQHAEVAALFDETVRTEGPARQRAFDRLADQLAIRMAIEEQIFYPACHRERTETMLFESLAEHLRVKRLIAELLDEPRVDETFEARLATLRDEVMGHLEAEEALLLPRVARMFSAERLADLGSEMEALVERLRGGQPRRAVSREIDSLPALE